MRCRNTGVPLPFGVSFTLGVETTCDGIVYAECVRLARVSFLKDRTLFLLQPLTPIKCETTPHVGTRYKASLRVVVIALVFTALSADGEGPNKEAVYFPTHRG